MEVWKSKIVMNISEFCCEKNLNKLNISGINKKKKNISKKIHSEFGKESIIKGFEIHYVHREEFNFI